MGAPPRTTRRSSPSRRARLRHEAEHGPATVPLTAEQRKLVTESLGLVTLHIHQRVIARGHYLHPDDYADLFQTGCLGLIVAARTYRPDSGMRFIAFALPRIRTAIHEALRDGGLIHVPRLRRAAPSKVPAESARASTRRPNPPILRLEELRCEPILPRVPEDCRLPVSLDALNAATTGELLRARIDAAIELATAEELRRPQGIREAIVRFFVAHRLAVPDADDRVSLRQIAEQFGVTYSQVLQLEHRMYSSLRRTLVADGQFTLLRNWLRRLSGGPASALDQGMVGQLRAAAAETFWKQVSRLRPAARERILLRLIQAAGAAAIRGVFATLPAPAADSVLAELSAA